MPVAGHVNPGLPIARALVGRGHEVVWYTGQHFRAAKVDNLSFSRGGEDLMAEVIRRDKGRSQRRTNCHRLAVNEVAQLYHK
jgi:UDP:flavonoid glycosyltransferase YjiC (YdhE family)